METRVRDHPMMKIHNQENLYVPEGKKNLLLPSKRLGLSVRGALGDLNTNVQVQRDVINSKITVTTTELEKKTRGVLKSNYNHVQSKIDTGLAAKSTIQPTARPPLKREESTGALAAKAVRTWAVSKENKQKQTNKQKDHKEAFNSLLQERNSRADIKKTSKLPMLKENSKETKNGLKPILKESTVSLGKLKLAEESVSLKSKELIKSKLTTEVDLGSPISTPPLPDDIEDIDANDSNHLLMSIYIKDIYSYLTKLEEKYPIEVEHLKKQTLITGHMRATLINWLVEVQRQFSLLLETFHLAVGIIDRYLQDGPVIQRHQFQLVGITALFIASKYEEIYSPEISDFVYVTDKAYTKNDVLRCERDIMSKLGFCLARPIPLSFLRRFAKAAKGSLKNHSLAKYLIDLSLLEYSLVHYKPSELAAAAMCLSLYLLSDKSLPAVWTPTLSYYSGYTLEHIDPIIRKMAEVAFNADTAKSNAVYSKYLDETLGKVARLPQLKGEAIRDLIRKSSK